MTPFRSVVAALSFFLLAQTASAACLTPAWELRIPPPPATSYFGENRLIDDFDGDGIGDAVFVRWNVASETATFHRGRGNGLFAAAVDIYTSTPAGVNNPWGIQHVVARDLNRDGKLDLLLLENLKRLVFLPGNGDGTFASPISSPVAIGELFAVAELTGDDVDDVAAFYYSDTGFGVVLFTGAANGTFTERARFPLPESARAIAAGDLDGDGANDIVADYGDPSRLAAMFGHDDGSFEPTVDRDNGDSWAITLELADLENDGDLDIVAQKASNFEYESDFLAVHRNRGGRTFDAVTVYDVPQVFSSNKYPVYSAVADVTGDGELDLFAAANNMVVTRRGLGDGTFDAIPHFDLFPDADLFPNRSAIASLHTTDFDGDGRVDAVLGLASFDGLRTMRNHCGEAKVLLTPSTSTVVLGQGLVTVQVATHSYSQDPLETPPPSPTGTVSILEGATVLTTGTLSNGAVTLNVPGLTLGTHMLLARYSGDTQYQPAQSARIVVRMTQRPATVTPPRRRSSRR